MCYCIIVYNYSDLASFTRPGSTSLVRSGIEANSDWNHINTHSNNDSSVLISREVPGPWNTERGCGTSLCLRKIEAKKAQVCSCLARLDYSCTALDRDLFTAIWGSPCFRGFFMMCIIRWAWPASKRETGLQPYSYRIAGNFRGAKYSWLEVRPRIFYPRMKRPCLPLYTYNPSSNHENIIHEMSQYCWTTNILSPENYPLYGI